MKINDFTPDTDMFKNMNISGDVSSTNKVSGSNSTDSTSDFGKLLESKLDDVNNDQIKADNSIQNFIEGNDTDIHNVMLDSEQGKLSLELAVQIRNKLVDAYQELSRTQM